MSVSAAFSVPFIFAAFNQARIARWIQALGRGSIWWIAPLLIVAILLSVIWTSHLAPGIKAALTVTIVLAGLLFIVGRGIHVLVAKARGSSNSDADVDKGSLDFSD